MAHTYTNLIHQFNRLLSSPLAAVAQVNGNAAHAGLHGEVLFFHIADGTLVVAELMGLPKGSGDCDRPILGFHIHEGGACSGTAQDPFADAGGHWNPGNCPHPMHAGDMPPLFSNDGCAWQAFYTNRFIPADVIGHTVIVHNMPDDFHSQPSGDAGQKIACGTIVQL